MPQESNPTAYVPLTRKGTALPGWAIGVTRYWGYNKTQTCDQGLSAFTALSDSEKVSFTDAAVPTPPTATPTWYLRDCSGGGSSNADDLSNEGNVTYYTP